jgi:hypothetical protein
MKLAMLALVSYHKTHDQSQSILTYYAASSQVPMSLLFQEQLFDFYSRVPPPSMVSLNASRSVFFLWKISIFCHFVCNLSSHQKSRIIAASLGAYMLMMFFAASLTSSKVQIVSLQSSEPVISSRHRRNISRAESPSPAAHGIWAGRAKRGRHSVPKAARFCDICLIPKAPR